VNAAAVWASMSAAAKDSTSIPCESCGKEIRRNDTTCPGCGRLVTDQDRALLQVKLEGHDYLAFERGRDVRKAAKWIGILTILLAIAAVVSFISTKVQADNALEQLSRLPDDEVLEPIDGKTYTVPELRAQVAREPYVALGVNVLLAVIMGAMWMWARHSPLPAITCAIAVFIIVQVANAIVDPGTLVSGILIKIFALIALGKG
jgi:hypothetical protein